MVDDAITFISEKQQPEENSKIHSSTEEDSEESKELDYDEEDA